MMYNIYIYINVYIYICVYIKIILIYLQYSLTSCPGPSPHGAKVSADQDMQRHRGLSCSCASPQFSAEAAPLQRGNIKDPTNEITGCVESSCRPPSSSNIHRETTLLQLASREHLLKNPTSFHPNHPNAHGFHVPECFP